MAEDMVGWKGGLRVIPRSTELPKLRDPLAGAEPGYL